MAEAKQLEQEKQQLKSSIEVETAKLLGERGEKLRNLEIPIFKRLDEFNTRIETRSQEVKALEHTVAGLIDEKIGIQESLVSLNADLDSSLKRSKNAQINLNDLAANISTLDAIIDKKKASVISLVDEKDNLTKEVTFYKINLAELKQNQIEILKNTENLKRESEDKLYQIELRTQKARKELEQHTKQVEIERKDIAMRLLGLNDRDKNLRIRERRVNSQEEDIKRNASLLEL